VDEAAEERALRDAAFAAKIHKLQKVSPAKTHFHFLNFFSSFLVWLCSFSGGKSARACAGGNIRNGEVICGCSQDAGQGKVVPHPTDDTPKSF